MKGNPAYDMVIVGAGPAGLSAARTAARLGFKTLVLERLPAAGDLAHACSGIIAPVPRQASSGPSGDLYFRKIDLTIPAALVTGYPTQQHWLGPTGSTFQTPLGGRPGRPAAAIDKAGLLRLMARQAQSAGAEIRFGSEVIGLIQEQGRVAGVMTEAGGIRGHMVLSAEGITRQLAGSVLPFERVGRSERYGLIVNQDMEAPAVGEEQLGQYITLGGRYTSARNAFGIVVAPRPRRLSVYFCMFADSPRHYTDRSAHFYLEEYMDEDPRVRDLCAGGRKIGQSIAHLRTGGAPTRVTLPGFMGVGDAITPSGYMGILPAIYLGRQAALVASGAIEAGDLGATHLSFYEYLFQERMLPDLKAEYRILAELADMTDEELDTFCKAPGLHRAALPFSAHARALDWETVGSRSTRRAGLVGHLPAPRPATMLPVPA